MMDRPPGRLRPKDGLSRYEKSPSVQFWRGGDNRRTGSVSDQEEESKLSRKNCNYSQTFNHIKRSRELPLSQNFLINQSARFKLRSQLFVYYFCLFSAILHQSLTLALTSRNQDDDNPSGLFAGQPLEPAFHEEPQALFLSPFANLETGSGNGFASSPSNQLQPDAGSSSVSPALIMAKCWNNYENDNDCKELNFITGEEGKSSPTSAGSNRKQEEDDSLITPVIVFESSTPLESEPEEPQFNNNFAAPPFFSSTPANPVDFASRNKQNNNNNQQQATINELDPFSSNSAGNNATVRLPATSSGGDFSNARPYTTRRPEVGVTSRPKSIFVATPAPKKAPKTTTMGRKCVDENDGDCDEPEESNNNNIRDEDDDDNERDNNDDDEQQTTEANRKLSESGSGEGPIDDNEEADDEDDENQLEGSGSNSDDTSSFNQIHSQPDKGSRLPSVTTASSQFVQITSTTTSVRPIAPEAKPPQAVIDVVVHSTLPPSFPVTTPPSRFPEVAPEPVVSSTQAPVTTTPSDDLYKSNPVFPPEVDQSISSNGENETASEFPFASSGLQMATTTTTTTTTTTEMIDLATFKPIPMPTAPSKYQPISNETEPLNSDQIANKHKLDTNVHQPLPVKLENPWREKPTAVRNSHLSSQQQQQQQFQEWGRFAKNNLGNDQSSAVFSNQQQQQQQLASRANSELLSKLFIYAVTIIVSIAIIMSVIVFIILRQRRRMMAMKQPILANQHHLLMNGAAGNGAYGMQTGGGGGQQQQMVASLGQGNQLLGGKVQQPSLLDTYAPGKGVVSLAGKINNVIKRDEEDEEEEEVEELEGEEEEQEQEEEEEEELEGSLVEKQRKATSADKRKLLATGQSSWSTEDQTTTSGSGSQKTNDSRQQIVDQTGQVELVRQSNSGRNQQTGYANSLSDGRQNSSSISDSNSPETGPIPIYPASQSQQVGPRNQQAMQQHQMQQPLGFNPANNPQRTGQLVYNVVNQNQFPPAKPPLFQDNGYNPLPMKGPFAGPNGQFNPMEQAYLEQKAVGLPQPNGFNNLRFAAPPRQPFPINQNPQNPIQPPASSIEAHFQRPINPARIALNPLATMARRHPQPAGLNRAIYSEDSSSFITASPSLARTSSSSSFAFTNNNGSQLNTPIRAKPFIDPTTGRLFNDYTQQAASNGTPPVLKRKSDFGEPWYV